MNGKDLDHLFPPHYPRRRCNSYKSHFCPLLFISRTSADAYRVNLHYLLLMVAGARNMPSKCSARGCNQDSSGINTLAKPAGSDAQRWSSLFLFSQFASTTRMTSRTTTPNSTRSVCILKEGHTPQTGVFHFNGTGAVSCDIAIPTNAGNRPCVLHFDTTHRYTVVTKALNSMGFLLLSLKLKLGNLAVELFLSSTPLRFYTALFGACAVLAKLVKL